MPHFACLPRENGIGYSSRNNKKNGITKRWVHDNEQRKILGVGACKITRATLHFRIIFKKWIVAGSRDARGEERVKKFGAVVDVFIIAIGESFKASEIVCFSSGSKFATEVIVEMIVVQSAVDDEYGCVWGVTVIIVGTCDCEEHTITGLVRTVTIR